MRLECVCGVQSGDVFNPARLTKQEMEMLTEFRTKHDDCPQQMLAKEGKLKTCGAFGSERPPARSALHPHGHVERIGPYGEVEECDTICCPHCGGHIEKRTGVENVTGWCFRCARATCGGPHCQECITIDQRLRNLEAGLPAETPAIVTVGVPENYHPLKVEVANG